MSSNAEVKVVEVIDLTGDIVMFTCPACVVGMHYHQGYVLDEVDVLEIVRRPFNPQNTNAAMLMK